MPSAFSLLLGFWRSVHSSAQRALSWACRMHSADAHQAQCVQQVLSRHTVHSADTQQAHISIQQVHNRHLVGTQGILSRHSAGT